MPETKIEGDGTFPETAWSTVLSTGDPDDPRRKAALERLVNAYWKPVYVYVRAAHHTIEDAKDLTQEFFCRALEGGLVGRYDRHLGRFRHYLKAALRNFLAKERRDARREKRGGGRIPVALDVAELEASFGGDWSNPDEVFDRQWAHEVLARGLSRLRSELTQAGKLRQFQVYELVDLHPDQPERPSYDDVSAKLELTVTQVTNYLHTTRKRMQEILRELIADYVVSKDDVAKELSELFAR